MSNCDLSGANWRRRVMDGLVIGCGGLSLLYSTTHLPHLERAQLGQFACLAATVLLIGSVTTLKLRVPTIVTPSDALIFLATFLLGTPAAALLAALNGAITSARATRSKSESLFLIASRTLGAFLASALFYALINYGSPERVPNLSGHPVLVESLLPAAITMVVLAALVGSSLLNLRQRLGGARVLGLSWLNQSLWVSLQGVATSLLMTLVFVLMQRYSPVYLLGMLPVIAASSVAMRFYFDKVEAPAHTLIEVRRLYEATVETLATAIDAKDQNSHEHLRRVQIYAAGVARVMELSDAETEALRTGALLHDIGKLAIPEHILNKPSKLTPAEFEKIKLHTVVGAQMLERIGFPYPVVPVVRHHHERWDGRGYPEGLRGAEIPLTARILSVVGSFDALREDRPYRPKLTREQACNLLVKQSGQHFDPQVVNTFLAHLPQFEREIEASGLRVEPVAASNFPRPEGLQAAEADPSQPYLEQIKAAHNEVYSLYEMARTLSISLNLEETIEIFVNKLRHVVPFETCAVYLHQEETNEALMRHAVGCDAEAFAGRRVLPGYGLTGWVLANHKVVCNTEPALDLAGLKLQAEEYKTLAIAPLTKGETTVGVIALYSKTLDCYSSDHLRLLETISEIAADALHNALHHAETTEYALTDALTGLPNARALYLQFSQEVNRANRQNTPLSILMMDLDCFKAINDTYGHQTGNDYLTGVSQVITSELRSYDYFARYAGDEFVALLPGATDRDLEDLIGRIHCAVEDFALPVNSKGGTQTVKAGVSIGAARYLTEGISLESLMSVADQRMYQNKQARKQVLMLDANDDLMQAIARL